jgi:hypothetical protein
MPPGAKLVSAAPPAVGRATTALVLVGPAGEHGAPAASGGDRHARARRRPAYRDERAGRARSGIAASVVAQPRQDPRSTAQRARLQRRRAARDEHAARLAEQRDDVQRDLRHRDLAERERPVGPVARDLVRLDVAVRVACEIEAAGPVERDVLHAADAEVHEPVVREAGVVRSRSRQRVHACAVGEEQRPARAHDEMLGELALLRRDRRHARIAEERIGRAERRQMHDRAAALKEPALRAQRGGHDDVARGTDVQRAQRAVGRQRDRRKAAAAERRVGLRSSGPTAGGRSPAPARSARPRFPVTAERGDRRTRGVAGSRAPSASHEGHTTNPSPSRTRPVCSATCNAEQANCEWERR